MTILFNKIEPSEEVSALTGENAQVIYSYLKDGLNETECFVTHGISFDDSKVVVDEISSLESSIIKYIRDNKSATKKGLLETLKSEVLDVETVLNDLIIFYPPYNEKRLWSEFVELFSNE